MEIFTKPLINWGIIGPGRIAHKFALGLQAVPGARLLGVASRDGEKAAQFAAQYGAPYSFDSYEALAQHPDIDVVYIATPHSYHCEHSLLCLNHQKAVLCEKPFALNPAQAAQMIATARNRGVFLMEAFWTRFLPPLQKVDELLASGWLGSIQSIQADLGFRAQVGPEHRLLNKSLGGGALLDIGVYPLFLSLYLLGWPQQIQVLKKMGPTGVDLSCQMLFEYPGGQTAQLSTSLLADTSAEANIYGDRGRIRLNAPWHTPTSLSLFANRSEQQSIHFDYQGNGYNYQVLEVMQCLRQGQTESKLWPLEKTLELSRLTALVANS